MLSDLGLATCGLVRKTHGSGWICLMFMQLAPHQPWGDWVGGPFLLVEATTQAPMGACWGTIDMDALVWMSLIARLGVMWLKAVGLSLLVGLAH